MFNDSINEKLFQDQLSGIYSKDLFFVMGENFLTIAKRYNRKTSLVYISVENFDELVDSHGKDFAETQLEALCQSLRSVLRESDFLSHFSQNSFGIHVAETDSFGTIMLIKRLENIFCTNESNYENINKLFQLNIVHATAPDEGITIAALISKTIEKAEKKKQSPAFNKELRNLNFWELIDSIIEKKYQPPFNTVTKEPTYLLKFSSFFIDQVQKFIFQDAMLNKERNGMLFAGVRDFSKPEIGITNYNALKNTRTTTYIMGLKGDNPFQMPHIIPVCLHDTKISFYRFIFSLYDKSAYALIGREENDNFFTGFHSSDFYFVEHIIARLQQYYFY